MSSMFMKLVWKWVWIKHPWALISQNWALNHDILYVYKCFLETQPKRIGFDAFDLGFWLGGAIWNFQILHSRSSGENGARAGNSSIQHLCTVLQSARAEDWALERRFESQARASVEWRFHPSSTFTVRSSGKVDARACTFVACPLEWVNLRSSGNLFFWKFWNSFQIASLHPHPILGIIRPSLRHLNEDIDVEHTKAN